MEDLVAHKPFETAPAILVSSVARPSSNTYAAVYTVGEGGGGELAPSSRSLRLGTSFQVLYFVVVTGGRHETRMHNMTCFLIKIP